MAIYTFACTKAHRVDRTGVQQLWPAIRSGVGNFGNDNACSTDIQTSPLFDSLYNSILRGILTFDTSTLAGLLGTDSILSATVRVKIASKQNTLGLSDSNGGLSIVESLIKDSVFNNQKYNLGNINLASIANTFNYSDLVIGNINTFTLNAAGRATIQTAGTSAFAIMSNIDVSGAAPVWGAGVRHAIALNGTYNNYALLTITTGSTATSKSMGSGAATRRRLRTINRSSDII